MEKEFNELLEQVRAEFPGYTVRMGLAAYEHVPAWWIELIDLPVKCECCLQTSPGNTFFTYSNSTFAAALADLRARVPK